MYALVIVIVPIVMVVVVVVFCEKRLSLPKDFFNTNRRGIKNGKILSFNVGIAANNKCTCVRACVCLCVQVYMLQFITRPCCCCVVTDGVRVCYSLLFIHTILLLHLSIRCCCCCNSLFLFTFNVLPQYDLT